MSTEKKERTVEEIQQEYTQLCAKAGHLQYSISALKTDLGLVNEQLRDLNLEASRAASKKSEEAPKLVAVETPVAPAEVAAEGTSS